MQRCFQKRKISSSSWGKETELDTGRNIADSECAWTIDLNKQNLPQTIPREKEKYPAQSGFLQSVGEAICPAICFPAGRAKGG
jgi:hypothetical protein